MIKDPHPDLGRALGRLEQEQGRKIEKGGPRKHPDAPPGTPAPPTDD